MTEYDEIYMKRALELALNGAGHVSPNPMVVAVIVAKGDKIIGEGWHRKYGEAHAEVNAFRSVRDEDVSLIPQSTIYVTLEPCSHYGKTPPCAELLIRKGIKRAVVGIVDPNPKVAGKGISMMRQAGIEVEVGILEEECREINIRFFTAHTYKRPWILLKWAQTESGKMANSDGSPLTISTPLTMELMHKERSMCDAIMVGTNTLMSDNPSLTTRLWPGNSPRPVIFQSEKIASEEVSSKLKIFDRDPVLLDPKKSLADNMHLLYSEYGITSLMVEGGAKLLNSFISAGLYDRIRRETAKESGE